MPANAKIKSQKRKGSEVSASKKNKGKGKCVADEKDGSDLGGGLSPEGRLATLDIFAGCGGLSEGLQQSGKSSQQNAAWSILWKSMLGFITWSLLISENLPFCTPRCFIYKVGY